MMSVFSLRTLRNSSASSPCTELLHNMKVSTVKHEKLTYIILSHAHVLFVKKVCLVGSTLLKIPRNLSRSNQVLLLWQDSIYDKQII